MRLRTNTSVSRLSLLLSLCVVKALAQSVNLSQFQQINGFPSTCTKAYNTPIPGCTPNDFTNDNPCSQACVAGLMALTSLINSSCAGISTSPNTLIGLFFEGQGVQALCPAVSSISVSTQPQTSAQPSAQPPASTPPAQGSLPPSTSTSIGQLSSSSSLSPLVLSTSAAGTTSQTTSTPTPMATANPSQTPLPPVNNPSSSSPLPSFTLSPALSSTASAQPQSTSSSNSFGGSIDPFGGSASAASGIELNRILLASLIGAAILTVLTL
ncbi:hypothetical protein MMC10_010257 [Thelotrema lepadinum]|nr:hypothetical protein [Thelotrema lepadinum]